MDKESHDIIDLYRRWLEGQYIRRVSMAEAVRDLLVRKGKEVMRESR